MRPKTAIAGVAAAAILAAVWFLIQTRQSPSHPHLEATPSAPAPRAGPVGPSPAAGEELMRLAGEGIPELTDAEIEAFVDSRHRDAAGLLAAFFLSGDPAWLDEAAERFPDRPEVALVILMQGGSAETRALWIERLRQHDPDNAVGLLFAARQAFDEGNAVSGLNELAGLAETPRTDFYMSTVRHALTDAYRHAGHGDLTAEWSGLARSPVPASELRSLGKSLAAAMEAAHAAGDPELTRQFGQAGLEVARRVVHGEPGDFLITRLIGISLQRQVLHQLDVFELVPGDRQLVADRLIEMDRDIATIRDLTSRHGEAISLLSDTEAVEFTRRLRRDGEYAALQWLSRREAAP